MTRVATNANFQSALLDLQRAQARGQDAQTRISTQKNATDLKGFGRGSETLTALRSMSSRIEGFINTGETVKARLETQALALDRIADAAQGAREAIGQAIASGRFDGLMLDLNGQYLAAQGGLNAKHQGSYLFAGARTTEAPVTADTLSDLAAAPDVASVFVNDDLKATSRLDEKTALTTGFLADEIGAPLMAVFRAIQEYHTGPAGPLDGQLDEAGKAFLEARLAELDDARETVIQAGARNGSIQNRVDTLLKAHEAQQTALGELIGDRTDADMAKAVTDLQMSQFSIQASAQVISQLQSTSLLNLLRF